MRIRHRLADVPNIRGWFKESDSLKPEWCSDSGGYFNCHMGAHPKALLSDQQVLDVRGRREFQGETREQLCEEYGLSPVYLSKLLNYEV